MEPQFEIRYTANRKMLREFYRKIGTGPRYPTVIAVLVGFAGLILYSAAQGMLAEVAETYTFCGLVFFAALFPALVYFVECLADIQAE